jgi:stress response protein YsnF
VADHYVISVKHGETLESLTVDDQDSDRVLAVMRRRTANPEPGTGEEAPLAGAGAGLGAAAALREDARLREEARAREEAKAREAASLREEVSAEPSPSMNVSAGAKKKTNGHFEMDDREEERIIPIVREEMRVGRRTVERGGVRISSHIVQKPVSEQVHLRETHVDIERRAVDRPLRTDEKAFVDDTVEMVEMADEPIVSKQARVVEEVVVRKHVEDHTETISDEVRATEIEFGKLRAFDPEAHRRHFEGEKAGGSFDSYLPAYQFGHELHRRRPAERWEHIEPYARERWEEDNPGTWEKFRRAIEHAWHYARSD